MLDDGKLLASLSAEIAKVGEPIPATLEQKEPDPTKYVPIEVVTALNEKIASTGNQKDPAEELVAEALSNGQLLPAQQSWAMLYAKKTLQGFKDYLSRQPKIAALTQSQTW